MHRQFRVANTVPGATRRLPAMKTIRIALAVAALAVAVCSCGAGARGDIEQAFRSYQQALLSRDFAAACAVNSPEATAKLLETVATQGIVVGTCEDAFAQIFAEQGPAATFDGIATTVQIQDVTVDGDEASIRWSASINGEPDTGTNVLRRIDGRWLLVPF